MNLRASSHLGNQVLLRRLEEETASNCVHTATLIALIAEVDRRRLFLPEGYPSMYAYCVQKLGMSEDVAQKRIRVARIARRFPSIIEAVAEGRLHLSGVVMLRRYLTAENGKSLLAAVERKTRAEIRQLLAERFPRPELLEWVQPVSPPSSPIPSTNPASSEHVQELPKSPAPGPVESPAARAQVTPLAPQRFALQVMLDHSDYDKLCYAQRLLGHAVPSGEIAAVLGRALDALIVQLEKRKFAATSRPRPGQHRSSANPRYIPPSVKRAVWERDGGQCSFVSETGQRCTATSRLEFDHMDPVARGGEATVERMRLLCRAHNQYEAECVFGAGFMSDKREEALRAGARAGALNAPAAAAETEIGPSLPPDDLHLALRTLGYRRDEVRRAAELCESIPEASLEERVRLALRHLMPPHRRVAASPAMAT